MFLSQMLIYFILSITLIAVMFEPFIGVIAYYVLDLVRPQNIFWWTLGNSNLSLWIAGFTAISWVFYTLKGGKRRVAWTTQNKLMVLFLGTIVLSHIFSYYKDPSWISLQRITKMILIYFITVNLLNSQTRIRLLIWSLILSIGYLAFRGNWQYFVLGYSKISSASFGRGVPLDNNGYALVFVMAIPLVYFLLYIEKKIWVKVFLIGLLPVLIHAVILTYSRGGFIGVAAVGILSLLRTKKKTVLFIAAALFIAITVRLAGPPVIYRLKSISTYEQDSAVMGRIESWKAGLRMMVHRPLVGVGLGNYRYLASSYNPEGIQGELVAHNAFIHTGGEAGIPALILYILILGSCFKDLGRIRKLAYFNDKDNQTYYYAAMFEASLWGYTICGIFLTLAWFELFYVFIALTVSLKQLAYINETVKVKRQSVKPVRMLSPVTIQ